jgi:SAM-dependent methyltransferase
LEKSFLLKNDLGLAERIGDFYYQLKDYTRAIPYFQYAVSQKPKDEKILNSYAFCLFRNSDYAQAFVVFNHLVALYPKRNYIAALVHIFKHCRYQGYSEDSFKVVLTCLKTDNLNHRDMARGWGELLCLAPQYQEFLSLSKETSLNWARLTPVLSDEYLLLGLEKLPILNAQLEFLFTYIRRQLLLNLNEATIWPKDILPFLAALSIQCWFNDFVYFEQDDEIELIKKLEEKFSNLPLSEKISDSDLYAFFVLSLYRPVYEILKNKSQLPLSKGQLYAIKSWLKYVIQNPQHEAELVPQIQSFSTIEDETSKAVQTMYEGRPYPRWRSINHFNITEDMKSLSKNISVLVAGCGTGQEPSQYLTTLPNAQITAIDLSRTSIAYGKRMLDELGLLSRITFYHGDLMQLKNFDKKFDYVTSSGVLHHLKDPEKGLASILTRLKEGGRMKIMLYSQIARDHVLNPASDYIKEKNYSPSDADIRRIRHEILNMPQEDIRRRCVWASDFFFLAECNDLLFHVQEHRYTFPKIKEMLDKFDLELVYLHIEPRIRKDYIDKNPHDPEMLDFESLHAYELENPVTFMGMYQLYLKRKGDQSQHPLEPIIRLGLC